MRTEEGIGKTREEAIKKALGTLGIEMADVDNIEILDEGSRGIFGLGARPVKVRLIANHLPDLPKPKPPAPKSAPKPAPRPAPEQAAPREAQPQRQERPRQEQRREQPREQRQDQRSDQRPEQRREQPQRGQSGRPQQQNRDRAGAPAKRDQQQPQRPQQRQQQPQQPQQQPAAGQSERGPRPKPQRPPRPEQRQAIPRPKPPQDPTDDTDAEALEAVPVDTLPAEARQEDMESATAITDDQGKEAAALLSEIIAKMEIAATVEFARADDGSARLNVESEDSAILIGRKGRNLSAMQYLINRIISRADTAENTERLVVDVEGYVGRRRETLESMALAFARRAKETGRNMRLKPLSPQERRIIHLALQNDEDIRTYSLGDSLYRSVIISPRNAQPERAPRPPRDGQSRPRGGRDGNRAPQQNRGPRPGGNRPPRPRQGNPRREEEVDPGAFGD